jgi:hypothetical protein
LIGHYLDDPDIKIGLTKNYPLSLVADSPISQTKIDNLEARHVVEHCRAHKAAGGEPATIEKPSPALRIFPSVRNASTQKTSIKKAAKPSLTYL